MLIFKIFQNAGSSPSSNIQTHAKNKKNHELSFFLNYGTANVTESSKIDSGPLCPIFLSSILNMKENNKTINIHVITYFHILFNTSKRKKSISIERKKITAKFAKGIIFFHSTCLDTQCCCCSSCSSSYTAALPHQP